MTTAETTQQPCPVCPHCGWNDTDCSEVFLKAIAGESRCQKCNSLYQWIKKFTGEHNENIVWTTYKKIA